MFFNVYKQEIKSFDLCCIRCLQDTGSCTLLTSYRIPHTGYRIQDTAYRDKYVHICIIVYVSKERYLLVFL